MDLHILGCPEYDFTIYTKCLSVSVWHKFCGHSITEIRFLCITLKKLRCCSKFLNSLTQQYRIKLRAVVSNTNYFKPIILKLIAFIYNRNSKTIRNFCVSGHTSPVKGKYPPRRREFYNADNFRNNVSKYLKIMVESYVCDNLN